MNACLTIMLVLAAASAAFNVGQDHPAKPASAPPVSTESVSWSAVKG